MKEWKPKEIKNLRSKYGVSQKKLAELLGVSRIHIYYLEGGERKSSKTLRLLLDCVEQRLKETEKGKEKRNHGKRHL